MRGKENVPAVLRRALDCMQLATQDVINTDGHRRLLRREGNAYAGRFGASAIFTTPTFPQQKHATFLLARSESEDPDFSLEVEHPDLGILGDMMRKQADDPVGEAGHRLVQLVIRCTLHACGPSCWKYSKPGVPDTCRQHTLLHT